MLTLAGALEVALTSTCDHVVLYDETRHAICVEPQTGPPDALNHLERATIVRPGHPLIAEMSLTWSVPSLLTSEPWSRSGRSRRCGGTR